MSGHWTRVFVCLCGRRLRGNGARYQHQRACPTMAALRLGIPFAELQDAVTMAHFFVGLHSAILYGLIEGMDADDIDIDRCVEVLEVAGRAGVVPLREEPAAV